MEWIRKSLRKKMLLMFFVFSIIPLIIFGITNYITTTNILEKKTSSLSDQAMDKLALYVSGELQTMLDMTSYYSKDYNIASIMDALPKTEEENETLNTALKNYIINGNLAIKRLNWIVNYIILTKKGMAYTSYSFLNKDDYGRMMAVIKREEWFKLLESSYSEHMWMGSRQDYLASNPSQNIYVASNIVSQFENKGVIITYISGQYLSRILDNSRLSNRSSLYIIDDDGNCVAEGNENNYPFEMLVNSFPQIKSIKETVPFKVSLQSKKYIAINKNLIFNGYDSKWHLFILSPLEDIEKDTRYIGYLIIALVVLLLITSVLMELLVNKVIITPVIRLNSLMTEVKKGNFKVYAEENTSDEVGQLGNGFNKMLESIKKYIASIKEEEAEKRKLEVRLLQEQIKPHFVRNTLNTIRLMAQMRKAFGISQAVASFSKLIDYNFKDTGFMTPVKEEIGYLKEYIYLQKLRYQNIFTSSIEIEEDIMDLKILKLSFQPIVENSIMHGFVEKQGQRKLIIKGYREPERIVFEITDDGVGIDLEILDKILMEEPVEMIAGSHGSIGIANVDKRIKMNFGSEYGISIASKKGYGTTVTMTFPIIT